MCPAPSLECASAAIAIANRVTARRKLRGVLVHLAARGLWDVDVPAAVVPPLSALPHSFVSASAQSSMYPPHDFRPLRHTRAMRNLAVYGAVPAAAAVAWLVRIFDRSDEPAWRPNSQRPPGLQPGALASEN